MKCGVILEAPPLLLPVSRVLKILPCYFVAKQRGLFINSIDQSTIQFQLGGLIQSENDLWLPLAKGGTVLFELVVCTMYSFGAYIGISKNYIMSKEDLSMREKSKHTKSRMP